MPACKRMKIDPYLSPCTKLKYKRIEDLNINLKTLNLIEEKVGSRIQCMSTGDHLPKYNPSSTDTNSKNKQTGHSEIEKLL